MNAEEFTKVMTYLGLAYNKEFEKEQVMVWYSFFVNTDLSDFKIAIKRLIQKNKYLPTIAEIKQELALIHRPKLQLNVDEEWDRVIHAIRDLGYYKQNEALNSLNSFTQEIVRTIEWQRLCISENIEWERRLFKELFENKKDTYEETFVLDEQQMTFSELLRIRKENETLTLDGVINE